MIDKARLRRVGVAALLALGLLTMRTSAGAATGERVVASGERIVIDANGFATGATITLRLIPTLTSQSAIANAGGHVQFLYVVPRLKIGDYLLAIVGAGRDMPQGPAASGGSSATVSVSSIEATVPRVVYEPFRVGGNGVESQPPIKRGGRGPIAFTGVPIELHLAVGLGAILAGIVVLVGVRRRRRRV